MGKGAPSGYEFNGPYDYPSYPSGRRDSELTSVGAWRSKTGEHSGSIWKSGFTAKGEPAKRDTYYKWSSKQGGNWKKLDNTKERMRVFSKMDARRNGSRWMANVGEGKDLSGLIANQMRNKGYDRKMGKKGGENLNRDRTGSLGSKRM
jgi:hypothetical protein